MVAEQVREGGSLARRWPSASVFPHVAVEMVEVGESTGALADMLNSVADFYDEENETSLTRFSNLIQPVLLIVMGVVIAGLLLSLYMPLFQSVVADVIAMAEPIAPRHPSRCTSSRQRRRSIAPPKRREARRLARATSSSSSISSTSTSITRCSAASRPI